MENKRRWGCCNVTVAALMLASLGDLATAEEYKTIFQVPFLDAKGQNFIVPLPFSAIQSTSGLDKKDNVVPQIPNPGTVDTVIPFRAMAGVSFRARTHRMELSSRSGQHNFGQHPFLINGLSIGRLSIKFRFFPET